MGDKMIPFVDRVLLVVQEVASDIKHLVTLKADRAELVAINTLISEKADKGTTLAEYSIQDAYTKNETIDLVDGRFQILIGTAPAALDTIQEIAAQMMADQSAAASIVTTLGTKADKSDLNTTDANLAILTSVVASKASQDSVNTLSSTVGSLNTNLAFKASQTSVDTLSGSVNTLSSAVSSKAENADLVSLTTTVTGKADKVSTYTKTETVSLVDARFAALIGTAPANLDTLQEIAAQMASDESAVSALTATVASKASQSSVDTLSGAVSDLSNTVDGKASQVDLTVLAARVMEAEVVTKDKMSVYRSDKDTYGVFRTITQKRSDGTTFRTSELSGGVAPQYSTRTLTFYAADGVTVSSTATYTLSYDTDGDVVSEVLN